MCACTCSIAGASWWAHQNNNNRNMENSRKRMKYLLFTTLCLLAVIGCEQHNRPRSIVTKVFIPREGICEYSYSDGLKWYAFQDSCNLYHVGDTIK